MSHLSLQIGTTLVIPLASPPWRNRALREAILGGADVRCRGDAALDRRLLPRVIERARADYHWRRTVRWRGKFRTKASP